VIYPPKLNRKLAIGLSEKRNECRYKGGWLQNELTNFFQPIFNYFKNLLAELLKYNYGEIKI
jgi:hypothetical protein